MRLRFTCSPRVCTARLYLTALAVVCALTVAISARESPTVARPYAYWDPTPGTVDPHIFQLALGAASCAIQAGRVADPGTLTVIDYSKPSTSRRLWVFDLHSRAMLFEEL